MSSIDQLTHATVRLESLAADGTVSTGTGFFFQFALDGGRVVPTLITNKHVVAGGTVLRLALTVRAADGRPAIGTHHSVEIANLQAGIVPHPDPLVDLCVIPFGPYMQELAERGARYFFVMLDASLIPTDEELGQFSALEEILMIGYPIGIWDHANNMPILRRGVTATHPALDFQNRKEFVIDAACFPGSSGSPVLIYNSGAWSGNGSFNIGSDRVKLLGLLWGGPQHQATGDVQVVTIPTSQRAVSVSAIPTNLGYVVKASRILEMASPLKALADAREQVQEG